MLKDQWSKFRQSYIAKIFVGYSLVAWVLIQLIEAVLPTFEAPLWVSQTLLFLLIIGFPLALVAGWVIEAGLTARSESEVPEAPRAKALGKTTLVLYSATALTLVALFGFYMLPFIFDRAPATTEPAKASTELAVTNSSNFRGMRTSVDLGETSINDWGLRTEIAVSPDGRYLAFTKNQESFSELFIKDLWFENETKKLAEYSWATDVHGVVFFSKEGNWVFFFDAGILKRVRVQGGSVQPLIKSPVFATSGYSASENQVILTGGRKLQRLDIQTGIMEALPFKDSAQSESSAYHRWPDVLPGMTHLLYTEAELGETDSGNVFLYDLSSFETSLLLYNAYNARFSPSGHIIFVRDAALWAVPFDLESMSLLGDPELVVDKIHSQGQVGAAVYSFSQKGHLFYLKGSDANVNSTGMNLSWVERDGSIRPIDLPKQGRIAAIRLSPSGDRILYTQYSSTQNSDLWIWDIKKKIASRRTFSGKASHGIWSEGGDSLIYNDRSEPGIWGVDASGAGQPIMIKESAGDLWPHAGFTDSKNLLLLRTRPEDRNFYIAELDDPDLPALENLTRLDAASGGRLTAYSLPRISPDGNWLAYASPEAGLMQIYIRPFPNVEDGKWQISFANAMSPLWSKNSKEIFFWSGGNQYSVSYSTGKLDSNEKPQFIDLAAPQKILSIQGLQNGLTLPAWDYDGNSDKFLMLETQTNSTFTGINEEGVSANTELYVIENWFEELNIRAPVIK